MSIFLSILTLMSCYVGSSKIKDESKVAYFVTVTLLLVLVLLLKIL